MHKTLSPLHPDEEKRSFYGYDIETRNDGVTFLSGAFWHSDERVLFFTERRTVIDLMKHRWFRNKIVMATNTMYDFMGTFDTNLEDDFEPEEMEFEMIVRGARLLSAKTHITPQGFKKRSEEHKHPNIVEFWDTLNFASGSVDEMGKLLTIPKTQHPKFLGIKSDYNPKPEKSRMPKDTAEWEELYHYNINDAKISKSFMLFLREFLIKINAPMRMTIASTAMAWFRANYLTREYHHPEMSDYADQFEAYYGGRVEVLERGEHTDIYYADANSLYPASMSEAEFPDIDTLRRTSENTEYYINEYHGYSLVDIECPDNILPLLPFRYNGKLIFPAGRFTGRYTHNELRKAVELGYKIHKVLETTYYKESVRPFTFMGDVYQQRKKYVAEGNTSMAFVMKILLNSLYGKFAQRFLSMEKFEPFNLTEDEIFELKNFQRRGNFYSAVEDSEPASFCIPIWSAYITSHARMKLYDFAVKYKTKYMDTDAIFTHDVVVSSAELGELKLEGFLDRCIFVKPKFYVLQYGEGKNKGKVEFKIKGVSLKQIVTLADSSTDKVVYDDMKKLILMPTVEYMKFRKAKEAKRSGKLVNQVFKTMKRLSIKDDKRVWDGSFPMEGSQKSRPIVLDRAISATVRERKKVD